MRLLLNYSLGERLKPKTRKAFFFVGTDLPIAPFQPEAPCTERLRHELPHLLAAGQTAECTVLGAERPIPVATGEDMSGARRRNPREGGASRLRDCLPAARRASTTAERAASVEIGAGT